MPLCLCRGHGYHLLLVAWLWMCLVFLLSELWFLKWTTDPGKQCSDRRLFILAIAIWTSCLGVFQFADDPSQADPTRPSLNVDVFFHPKSARWNSTQIQGRCPRDVICLILQRMWMYVLYSYVEWMSFTVVGVHCSLLNLWKSVVCWCMLD